MLDWKRFVTDAVAAYQQGQIDAIRAVSDPHQFITATSWDTTSMASIITSSRAR